MEIPRAIGELINVVSKYVMSSEISLGSDILRSLREPVAKLVALFLAQGFSSFAYIYMIFSVGEHLGEKLRFEFRSLMVVN